MRLMHLNDNDRIQDSHLHTHTHTGAPSNHDRVKPALVEPLLEIREMKHVAIANHGHAAKRPLTLLGVAHIGGGRCRGNGGAAIDVRPVGESRVALGARAAVQLRFLSASASR